MKISRELNYIMQELKNDPRNFGEIFLNLRYGDFEGFLAVMHTSSALYGAPEDSHGDRR